MAKFVPEDTFGPAQEAGRSSGRVLSREIKHCINVQLAVHYVPCTMEWKGSAHCEGSNREMDRWIQDAGISTLCIKVEAEKISDIVELKRGGQPLIVTAAAAGLRITEPRATPCGS